MGGLRSALFNLFYVTWTLAVGIAALPVLLFAPGRVKGSVARLWLGGFLGASRVILGLRYEVRGTERLPPGGLVVAAKHQSAYDTFLFHFLLSDPVFVLKEELTRIPLLGSYLRRAGMISVDRSAGAGALRGMVRQARLAVERGDQVVIFPEGTRTEPGADARYHPGVAALYTQLDVPVVPVALNSGLYWPRNSFAKRPGTVVVEILDPIAPGLDRKAFLAELRRRIEGAARPLAGLPPPESPLPVETAVENKAGTDP